MIITENIIISYLNCSYKSYLKLNNQIGERHLLQQRYENCILEYTEQFKTILRNREKSIFVFENDFNLIKIVKSKRCEYFFNATLKTEEHEAKVNIKKSIENNQVKFSPVLIIADEKINEKHKILLAYYSCIIQLLFLITTDHGEIIYGKNVSLKKIYIKRFIPKIATIINNIRKVHENSDQYFSLNKHCRICEYSKICKAKAIELDHLSLISTIKETDIRRLNSKGIFTVNQLSYTFKPRRKPKRQKNKVRKHFIALKALALRKKTIYILDSNIELENSSTKIYFDVEGYEEGNNFYYLIGVIIKREGIEIEKSYWISLKEDAKEVYKTFLKDLETFSGDNFIMFHYGKYEKEFLRYLLTFIDTAEEKFFLEKLTSNSKDVLSYFLNEIYFPTFSNDLKSISTCIGFNWTTKEASGLNSIAWRKYWEDERKIDWKNTLITYNMEDCRSLKTVVDFLYSITNDDQTKKM